MYSIEKEDFGVYQLKDVPQIWSKQWKDSRPIEIRPIEWETFKLDFLGRFFLGELKRATME